MAYRDFTASGGADGKSNHQELRLQIDGQRVDLPDASYARDADMTREGADLILKGPQGTVVVEGYFAAEPAPDLTAPDGSTLTPALVESFVHGAPQYAANETASDASPVGAVQEVTGHATVQRTDGSVHDIVKGMPIYEGDVIATDAKGAVNIVFADQTSFAVSEDARLAIDEYVYDPSTQSGSTDFSVLKGVFVFTSGLIGRDDPDDVQIKTPAGSIGIRGTIIAGNLHTGEITVVEGAIVLRDFSGHEVTLASQFETARFTSGGGIDHMGQISAQDMTARFSSIGAVAPSFFSPISGAAQGQDAPAAQDGTAPADAPADGVLQPGPEGENGAALETIQPFLTPGDSGFGPPPGGFIAGDALFGAGPLPPPPGGISGPGLPPPPPLGFGPPPPPPGGGFFSGNVTTTTHFSPPSTDTAPIYSPEAPPVFFASAEGQNWEYFFDKAFINADAGDHLTFSLGSTTIVELDDWVSSNILINWQFDAANGHLQLNFDNAFTSDSMNIHVTATDEGGKSASASHAFTAHGGATPISGASQTIDNVSNDLFVNITNNANNVTLSSGNVTHDNDIFLGGGNDTIQLINSGAAGNTIYMGDGANTANVLGGGDINNTFIGGDQLDNFGIGNAQNIFHGMDGDDDFSFALNDSTLMSQFTTASNPNILIDGGHSNLHAAIALQSLGINQPWMHSAIDEGRGDTVKLNNMGTIDFTTIDNNYFKNIERIDATDASAQTVTLNYNDVLAMTDGKRTLLINLGAGDTLNFDKMSHSFVDRGHVYVDETRGGVSTATIGDDTNYRVFTDGNITLLINDTSGATVTGI